MTPARHAPDTPLNPREFLILLALSDGPLHGYGILKAVEAESGGAVQFDPANLYRSLRRLQRDRLIAETEPPGGDRRRTFSLTPVGRRAVKAEALRVHRLARAPLVRRLVPQADRKR